MRRRARHRAGKRCEYCRIQEDDDPFAFHLEHIIPHKHGGSDSISNLAWCCQSCNLGKGSNLAGRLSGEIVALFHPRLQKWDQHFRWHGPRLIGRTRCGKATVRVLNINSPERIELRRLLIVLGEFPP